MRALWRALLAFALARGALRAGQSRPEEDDGIDPSRYEVGAAPWAERTLAALLVLAGLAFAVFAVLLARSGDTQWLGISAGLGLACVAAALIVAGLRVVPQETAVEERPIHGSPDVDAEDERLIAAAADGVSRRGLIVGAAGVAGTGALAAAAVPLTAIGPSPHALNDAPWKAGTLIVDEEDRPVTAASLEVGSFVTAFPKGADKRELGSPIVVLRIEPATLRLPAARRTWAPQGIMAFSKICTHAGCAVSLFRYPVSEETSSPPALVCPCHYSTFDVRRAAKVVQGPAGRALPQLPLRIAADGSLVAAGPLSGSVGPAWWGTHR
jgi:ubiquinol-cytochrome c reductase iron-sulfur subunit